MHTKLSQLICIILPIVFMSTAFARGEGRTGRLNDLADSIVKKARDVRSEMGNLHRGSEGTKEISKQIGELQDLVDHLDLAVRRVSRKKSGLTINLRSKQVLQCRKGRQPKGGQLDTQISLPRIWRGEPAAFTLTAVVSVRRQRDCYVSCEFEVRQNNGRSSISPDTLICYGSWRFNQPAGQVVKTIGNSNGWRDLQLFQRDASPRRSRY